MLLPRESGPTGATHPASQSILVVDDDVDLLRLVREVLASHVSCTVDTTPSPEYAFELSLKKSYGLFLFDFSMPVIDGAVLYTFIRLAYQYPVATAPARTLPPLVLMSGNAEKPRAQDLLHEPGVRGLLPKPFSIERLLKTVEANLAHV